MVANGLEAVEAVRLAPYHMVFMDVQMPEMDGLAATAAIRALHLPSSRVWIIALTANAFAKMRAQRCLAAGMNDFLAKPIRPDDLRACLERVPAAMSRSTLRRSHWAFGPGRKQAGNSRRLKRRTARPIIPHGRIRRSPRPDDPRLTRTVPGIDQEGKAVETAVVMERPLTLFLNGREIVTMMTIGDHPDYLAVGYLLNQNMLLPGDRITAIDYDDDIETVVVRTDRETDFEDKLKKKTLTSGCAQGTVFGDLMEKFDEIRLDPAAILKTSWLYALRPQDQHRAEPLPRRRRDPRLRAVRGGPAAHLHGGCRPPQRDRQDRRLHAPQRHLAGRQDLLHNRPSDLGDGDQDGADGHPILISSLRLYRLGGRPRAAGRVDPDRPRQGAAALSRWPAPSASSSTATAARRRRIAVRSSRKASLPEETA